MRFFKKRSLKEWLQLCFAGLALILFVAGLASFDYETALPPVLEPNQSLSGEAPVVHDGDSFKLNEQKIRLWGIDAPELEQTCAMADGKVWDCGLQARDSLQKLLAGHEVVCEPKGESYGRVVARCIAGDVDVGQALILSGLAISEWYNSRAPYLANEKAAKQAKLGIWAGDFEKPSQWRLCNLPQNKQNKPASCGKAYRPNL